MDLRHSVRDCILVYSVSPGKSSTRTKVHCYALIWDLIVTYSLNPILNYEKLKSSKIKDQTPQNYGVTQEEKEQI